MGKEFVYRFRSKRIVFIIVKLRLHVCLHVGMRVRVQVPMKARGVRSLEAGITASCALLSMGAGS